jgi:hypothetical protein
MHDLRKRAEREIVSALFPLKLMSIVSRYAPILRGIIVAGDGGELSNCVLTAAVMERVFSRFELLTAYMPARVSAYNRAAVDWLRSPDFDKQVPPPPDARVHVIGDDSNEPFGSLSDAHWNGHISNIVAVRDAGNTYFFLADLSIDQVSDESHSLNLQPFLTEISDPRHSPYYTIANGEEDDPDFALISYEPYWRVNTYKETYYWHNKKLIETTADRVIRSIYELTALELI